MEPSFASKPQVCFEVEKIIGYSCDGNVRTYQVQWAPAWVSSFHLVGCENLIQEFLQQQTEVVKNNTEVATTSSTAKLSNIKADHTDLNEMRHHDSSASFSDQICNVPDDDCLNRDRGSQSVICSNEPDIKIKTEQEDDEARITPNRRSSMTFVKVEVPQNFGKSDTDDLSSPTETSDDIPTHSGNRSHDYTPYDTQQYYQQTRPLEHPWNQLFACRFCRKQFTKKTHLESHLQTRHSAKPYPCEVCAKAFSDRRNLQRHVRIHSGVKPYTCEICFKSFAQSNTLKNHRQTHSSERFNCTWCGKLFATSRTCAKHVKTCTNNPDAVLD